MAQIKVNISNRKFEGVFIPAEIYTSNELTWSEKLLLIEINSLDNENGCFASNEYFANFLGLQENTITRLVSSLKDKGLIYQEAFNGRQRVLRLQDPWQVIQLKVKRGLKSVSDEGSAQYLNTGLNNLYHLYYNKQIINLSKDKYASHIDAAESILKTWTDNISKFRDKVDAQLKIDKRDIIVNYPTKHKSIESKCPIINPMSVTDSKSYILFHIISSTLYTSQLEKLDDSVNLINKCIDNYFIVVYDNLFGNIYVNKRHYSNLGMFLHIGNQNNTGYLDFQNLEILKLDYKLPAIDKIYREFKPTLITSYNKQSPLDTENSTYLGHPVEELKSIDTEDTWLTIKDRFKTDNLRFSDYVNVEKLIIINLYKRKHTFNEKLLRRLMYIRDSNMAKFSSEIEEYSKSKL